MKIPQSVRVLYQELQPQYERLRGEVDRLILGKKQYRWHYESRVKNEESFALKLETGRVKDVSRPEDFFGCTLVVENKARIEEAEAIILGSFDLAYRRPRDPKVTHLYPHSFDFDDLRLYVKWKDGPAARPTGLAGLLFEVQIKTFLQHAWGIATHDLIYKADEVEWSTNRIAFQVKAMLESAELSIAEAKKLTGSKTLDRSDNECKYLQSAIEALKARWEANQLPSDLRRLAQNVLEMSVILDIRIDYVWESVDAATAAGKGAKTLNLSPFGAILEALIDAMGVRLFEPLQHDRVQKSIFVPLEIALPRLSANAQRKVIQPPRRSA